MRMRRTVRDAWVKALRSGEYEQAQGALAEVVDVRDNVPVMGFCCLGVLCEVARKDGLPVVREGGESSRGNPVYLYDCEVNFPPRSVAHWAGEDDNVSWAVSYIDPDDELDVRAELADRNDGGATFREIADMIENDLDAVDDVRDDLAEVQS